jgi:hypothetical protein
MGLWLHVIKGVLSDCGILYGTFQAIRQRVDRLQGPPALPCTILGM